MQIKQICFGHNLKLMNSLLNRNRAQEENTNHKACPSKLILKG